MPESAINDRPSHQWYARPGLFVTDIQRALRFYLETLGFTKKWHEPTAREPSARSIAAGAFWGYDVIRILDPDGNELLFPLDETNDRDKERR